MSARTIKSEPLTVEAFAPFGDVIAAGGGERMMINDGTSERFNDIARIDVGAEGGRPNLSFVHAQPRALPLTVRMVERHPLGSQAFMPLGPTPFLVLVAPAGDQVTAADLRAFRTAPGQGINYRRGVWHHPLIALERVSEFIVIDRGGEGENCDEIVFGDDEIVLVG
ncbi:MAG TPA: ureidoglycolate lyase [Alphaproteobacteria bacterium]|nr:ureidoglycolate lyase [Alphaproteobacteria bacterium]